MGFAKQQQLEYEAYGLSAVRDSYVCATHFEDYAIIDFIKANSVQGSCSYCKKKRKVVELEQLMFFLMKGIMKFYKDAAEFMYYESAEGGYLGGDIFSPEELINDQVCLEVDNDELRDDIVNSIDDRAWSTERFYYDDDSEISVYHWDFFKDVVKYKSRYFFGSTSAFKTFSYKQDAYSILEEIGDKTVLLNLIKTIPKGSNLFRCRQHGSKDDVKGAKDIASPPTAKYSNRMSPFGISMFYGSLDRETAKAETFDPKSTDQFLSSATFTPRKDLKVVDLATLPRIPSIFDLGNFKLYYSIKFLREFAKDISQPIARDGMEHLEYVPTQVITEFFRLIFPERHGIAVDGIIYASAKRKNETSLVLFFDHETSLKKLKFISHITEKVNI